MNTLDIRKKIENLIDESRHDTLKNLNAIKHIGIDSEKNVVILIIEIGMMAGEAEYHLKRQLAKAVKIDLGFKGIKISFQETRNFQNTFNKNTKFIIVTSGKGGVGKSFVSCNLAYALTRLGKKVGLIDADIYGASIPKLLETPYASIQVNNHNKIIPFKAFGIEFISTEFFTDEGRPIVWRGSVLSNMINNFFYQVAWSKDLDYVIVDAPTGTGDVLLDLSKIIPFSEGLVVTTPEQTSAFIAAKAGIALKDMKHNIIGVIENMCDENIFGKGGAELVASKLDSEVLVQVPIARPKYHSYLYEENEDNGKVFNDLANIITIR
jgi:ATP-binding protein involved in chromosome partitioning